ncbi:hypothetical protein CRYUN_Cryun40dG0081500 [Craigia yunnanensis]
MVCDSAMNMALKIGSFLNKIRRSSKLKYYRYNRLVDDQSDHGVAETIDKGPRIYVSVYVGIEAKRYDVPLMYLSLPMFQQIMIRPQGNDLDTNLDRPITVDCIPEAFELLLELWSFTWDFDEGNFFIFLKKFENWSRLRHEYLTAQAATRSGETSLSFSC